MQTTMLTGDVAPPPPPVGQGPNDAYAQALYPASPPPVKDVAPTPEIAALRAADPAREIYADAGTGQLGAAARTMALAVAPSADAGELDVMTASWASVAVDLGFDRSDLEILAGLAAANKARPPTPDELRQHALTAAKALREQYGDAGFGEALAGAKALAMRDGRFAKFLDASGLNAHPTVALRLAELARSPRNRAAAKRT